MMNTMSTDPTSDDLDRLLDANPEAGEHIAPCEDIKVLLEVPLDPATLDRLTERAAREGRDIEDLVVDALRSAAA
jgi:hypothetical protein